MEYKLKMDNKRSSMTDEKISALEAIGFVWAKPNGLQRWHGYFLELHAFHVEHSHANVPTKYTKNPALGRWMSTQRSEYIKFTQDEKSSLTCEKIEKLNTLGFCWSAQSQKGGSRSEV
uniref:Helicase-associated domain-containing protein n=1 Tax=Attheya septentrionalis TaxID=420275 RepID=A0A7S2U853_9STRA|mmetsp:Transcript_12833/g.23227  ORF Transcript_12833/g.23227 Transcript_12833/m.23227 type:complete len:118 (+) Transcript_12833:268-621(+)